MKKSFIFLLMVLVLISYVLSGCTKAQPSVANHITLAEPIIGTKSSINIVVDPRIELLSIVQYLGNYKNLNDSFINNYSFEYKEKIDQHFSSFKDHEAVKFFDKISKKGLTFDAPPALMLFMDDNFNLREDVELTDYIIRRANGRKNIEKLFIHLENFCTETDFIDFYNNNIEFYNEIIKGTLDIINNEKNIIEQLEDYYGIKQKSYNVVLVSLYGGGSYGPRIQTKDGKFEIYSIIGPYFKDFDGSLSFGSERYFIHLQQHEFSHSFINPLTEKNINLANLYSELYKPIKSTMKDMAYSNWETCLNEHIIRALTARFAYLENPDEGIRHLEADKENGFIYIKALFNKLEEYENNRDKYPAIEDFYPELLKSLDEFKK